MPRIPRSIFDINSSEAFCKKFFPWYNQDHYHSGIAWLTPESVHYGRGAEVLEKRYQAMLKAYYLKILGDSIIKIPKLKQLAAAVLYKPTAGSRNKGKKRKYWK